MAVLAIAPAGLACGEERERRERAETKLERGEGPRERPEPRPERERGPEPRPKPATEPESRSPLIPAAAKRSRVTDVADGDTVDLAGLGSSRLIGIDTPEVYFGAECFGAEASAFTKRWLAPGTVVYYLRGAERRDSFDRDLVYIWLEGGTFFNALLARQGYAVPLTIEPNDRFESLFERLARAAEAARRGLWAARTCAGDPHLPLDG